MSRPICCPRDGRAGHGVRLQLISAKMDNVNGFAAYLAQSIPVQDRLKLVKKAQYGSHPLAECCDAGAGLYQSRDFPVQQAGGSLPGTLPGGQSE